VLGVSLSEKDRKEEGGIYKRILSRKTSLDKFQDIWSFGVSLSYGRRGRRGARKNKEAASGTTPRH